MVLACIYIYKITSPGGVTYSIMTTVNPVLYYLKVVKRVILKVLITRKNFVTSVVTDAS